MNILVTGASGLVGRALVPFLTAEGHRIVELRRSPSGAEQAQATWNPEAGQIDLSRAGPFDAIVHLAGENIARRWTPDVKARIRESRVLGTRLLCQAAARLQRPPRTLVCASATGYYGDRGEEVLDEQSAPGAGFLAEVCREWEAAAATARQGGMRVVCLRLGVVLAPQGGALAKMLPVFRLGLGGPVGSGRQYWSWITLTDLAPVISHCLKDEELSGPVNAVAPHPVTSREFARSLAAALGRPAIFPAPAFVIRLFLGEMGQDTLLASARVRPARLEQSGFRFQFSQLEEAFRHLLPRRLPRA